VVYTLTGLKYRLRSDCGWEGRAVAVPTATSTESTPSVPPALADVVRQLVGYAVETRPPALDGGAQLDGRRVVLDVEIEGIRCLLLAPRWPPAPGEHALSPREQEIARMVAQGYPTKTIAAVLDISSWTVSTYLRRIFAKLGVRSRAAMVARVLEEGLVSNEPEPPSAARR
jgi:DNA-binding CsgD family transcriptional regulator